MAAALEVVADQGFDRTTVQMIAGRAGASKETIYAWFGGREQVIAAVIEVNADDVADTVSRILATGDRTTIEQARAALTAYGGAQLRLLTGRQSVMLNRAAMSSPTLAKVLLAGGRHKVGPIVESYLRRLDDDGVISIPSTAEAFRLLYGLVVRDTQIRVLLGDEPPNAAAITSQAQVAVEQFFQLTRPV